MACVPPQTLAQASSFEPGPRDYLNRLIQLISTLRGGQSRYLPLLVNKVNEVLPGHTIPFAVPGLQTGSTSSTSNARMDEMYESSAGSASHEATPYDSPPPQAQAGGPLSIRPNPHVMPNQQPNYSIHYENAPSHVAGMPSGYSLFQASMGYPELSSSGPSHHVQASQEAANSMYSSHMPQGGHGGVGRGYGD